MERASLGKVGRCGGSGRPGAAVGASLLPLHTRTERPLAAAVTCSAQFGGKRRVTPGPDYSLARVHGRLVWLLGSAVRSGASKCMVLAVRGWTTGFDRKPASDAVAGDQAPAVLGDLYAAGWGLQER